VTDDNIDARDRALALMKDGKARPAEIARLLGVSRQLISYWLSTTDINWVKARDRRLAREWDALN
jgi:hypothetical protein